MLVFGERGKMEGRVENQQIQLAYGVEDGIKPRPCLWKASAITTVPAPLLQGDCEVTLAADMSRIALILDTCFDKCYKVSPCT